MRFSEWPHSSRITLVKDRFFSWRELFVQISWVIPELGEFSLSRVQFGGFEIFEFIFIEDFLSPCELKMYAVVLMSEKASDSIAPLEIIALVVITCHVPHQESSLCFLAGRLWHRTQIPALTSRS